MKSFYPWLPPMILGALALLSTAQFGLDFEAPEIKVQRALPATAPAQPLGKRDILIFTKTNGYRHQSIEVGAKALVLLGKRTGAFEATVTEDLKFFEREALNQFDAVCFLSTTQDVFRPKNFAQLAGDEKQVAEERDARLKGNLQAFVRSGKGFIGIHAAADTLHEWSEYGEMIGGYFDGHPWTAGTQVSIRVSDGQAEHPINLTWQGMNQDFKEEIYQFKAPYDSRKLHMLLRLDTEKSDMKRRGIKRKDEDFGVSWIRRWGQGRVYYCSLGHNNHIFWNQRVLEHYLAGIQWALGDLDVPLEPEKAN